MITSFWAPKGGQGVTTTAALAAVGASAWKPTVAVDLRGDLPHLLGQNSGHDGIVGWADAGLGAEALEDRCQAAGDGLWILNRGHGPIAEDRADELVGWLRSLSCNVVVDAGTLDPFDYGARGDTALRQKVVEGSDRSIAVTRSCSLSARRFAYSALPTGVVVVAEPIRVLNADAFAAVLPAPVEEVIDMDTTIAVAADYGTIEAAAWTATCERLGALVDTGTAKPTETVVPAPGGAGRLEWCPQWKPRTRQAFLAAASWALQRRFGAHEIDESTGAVTAISGEPDTTLRAAAITCAERSEADWRRHLDEKIGQLSTSAEMGRVDEFLYPPGRGRSARDDAAQRCTGLEVGL